MTEGVDEQVDPFRHVTPLAHKPASANGGAPTEQDRSDPAVEGFIRTR